MPIDQSISEGLGGSKYVAPETRQFNGDSRPQADCDQQRELAYPMKSDRRKLRRGKARSSRFGPFLMSDKLQTRNYFVPVGSTGQ